MSAAAPRADGEINLALIELCHFLMDAIHHAGQNLWFPSAAAACLTAPSRQERPKMSPVGRRATFLIF